MIRMLIGVFDVIKLLYFPMCCLWSDCLGEGPPPPDERMINPSVSSKVQVDERAVPVELPSSTLYKMADVRQIVPIMQCD